MPGVYQYSIDRLNEIMDKVKGERNFRRPFVLEYRPVKTRMGTQACKGWYYPACCFLYQEKIILKSIVSLMYVCVEYTSHGHCGVVRGWADNQ